MKKENIFFSDVAEIGATHEPIEKFATGNRITPSASATSVREGTIAFSDGGDLCYTKKDKNGVGRWFSAGLKFDYNKLKSFKFKQNWSGKKGQYDGSVWIEFSTRDDIDPIRIDFTISRLLSEEVDISYVFEATLYELSAQQGKTLIQDLGSTAPADAYRWFDELERYLNSNYKAFRSGATLDDLKYDFYQLQNLVSKIAVDLKMKFPSTSSTTQSGSNPFPNSGLKSIYSLSDFRLVNFFDTKITVDTPEKSEKFQRLIFELGGSWIGGDKTVHNTDFKYIVVTEKGEMTASDKAYYDITPEREIFYDDIFETQTPAQNLSKYNGYKPEELIEEFFALYQINETPTPDELYKALSSKRRTKQQKYVISACFGTFSMLYKNGMQKSDWDLFTEAYSESMRLPFDANDTKYQKYAIKRDFSNISSETPVWQFSDLTSEGWNDDLVYPMYFEEKLKDPNFGVTLMDAYTKWYDAKILAERSSGTQTEKQTETVVTPPKTAPITTPKVENKVVHNSIVPDKTFQELETEYADLMFLISITPSIDFAEMSALKQQSRELKSQIDASALIIKDMVLQENNIFDELFTASSIPPKHRYDLSPDPNGFAPDGTPTQLPKSIFELTLTDEFENWFGNFQLAYQFKNSQYTEVPCSIVKNVHYEPQIVFHGTGDEFSFFDFSQFPIMYFAENYAYAEWFAQQKGSRNGHDGYIYPFFLDIKNPLDLTHFGIDEITPQEFIDWLYLETGLEPDELKINPALLSSNQPTWAWVYLRNGEEMLKVLRDTKLFDGIVYYEQNPPINPTAPNYKTKGFIIFEPQSAKIVDPERHNLLLPSMRSFYLKKGGKL